LIAITLFSTASADARRGGGWLFEGWRAFDRSRIAGGTPRNDYAPRAFPFQATRPSSTRPTQKCGLRAGACEAAITRSSPGLPHGPRLTASLISATAPSALWIEASEAQRDELHHRRTFFRLVRGSVPESDRALFRGLAIFVGASQRSHREAKPSAQAGFGSCRFARHLRGVTRRRTCA
jgi:hypothetical protein